MSHKLFWVIKISYEQFERRAFEFEKICPSRHICTSFMSHDSFHMWHDSFEMWCDSFDTWHDLFYMWHNLFDMWHNLFDMWHDSFDKWHVSYVYETKVIFQYLQSYRIWMRCHVGISIHVMHEKVVTCVF